MPDNNTKRTILFCLAFLSLWALCITKIAPTYIAGDSPETIMAFNFLGIQHPPGYVLNTLLGKIFILIPLGNIMFRSAMLAMFFNIATAIALFMLALVIFAEKGKKTEVYCAALMTAAFYLFSNTVFFQGLTAKGSVYTLHGFLIAVIFLSLFKIRENMKYIYLASFLFGLSLGNHWQSSAVLFPAMALSVFMGGKSIGAKTWLKCSLFFLAGVSVFIYLFIRSAAHPVFAWGDVKDLKSLIWLLSRGQYTPLEHAHTLGDTIRLFKYYFLNILPGEYPLLLAFILIPGAGLLAWKERRYGYALAAGFMSAVAGVLIVATNEPGLEFIIRQFLTFTCIFTAIFIAYCIYWAVNLLKAKPIRMTMMFLSLALIIFLLYAKVPDYSGYFISHDYTKNLAKSVPEGALYFAEGDLNGFGALYMNNIEKKNINVITVLLLDQDWYREQLKRTGNGALTVTDKASNPVDDIKNLMYVNRDKGIYYSNAYTESLLSFPLAPRGIVNEVLISGKQPDYDPYFYYKLYSYRGIFDNKIKYDDFTVLYTFEHYGLSLQVLGARFDAKGDIEKALFYYRRSFLFYKNADVAAAMGRCYIRKGDYEPALDCLKQALQINEKCVPAHYYMAVYYMVMRDIAGARKNISEILEIDGNNEDAKALLRKLDGGV